MSTTRFDFVTEQLKDTEQHILHMVQGLWTMYCIFDNFDNFTCSPYVVNISANNAT